jgi:transcription elongation factor GreA
MYNNKHMRTPQRKPGKYAGSKTDPHISLAKYKELKDKLERLKAYSQPRAVREVKLLAQDGDFSENAAYQIAKGKLRGINQRIIDIEDHLRRAIVIEPSDNSGIIKIGSQVNVEVNGINKAFQILGPTEADPRQGIISYLSPLGKLFIGKKPGDTVTLKLKEKTIKYKINKIL